MSNNDEVLGRTAVALAAIKKSYGTDAGAQGANLFVSHHLEEMDGQYWLEYLKAERPNGARVLDILTLRSHWGHDDGEDEQGLDVFDFTLPGEVTDYVISVQFDEAGTITDMTMES